jgi:Tfp pilus assembly protein PilX
VMAVGLLVLLHVAYTGLTQAQAVLTERRRPSRT